uniref:Uncharacterized protein n=1 Tax=Chromera velia CCMP2878 TaxID=1169474 RepID=A0A0G4IBJ3_9ALVE|eukprot:Cvel_12873.t1-p1 / transcript=Cvel_12873.t1 / gene=Cvel_12873 / organism=Chromera_velia_CCMP2878 / gene_product=Ribosomal RNA small subunit methyltransferase H, putative / transcript_product=Ribosomal RNA small subunit methyltransferase H, putative / location=Cvel_scaffold859:25204-27551(+) / protein_length=534 / sequence_SO=supercontig / SO=protein_coding / is_pseudo=false
MRRSFKSKGRLRPQSLTLVAALLFIVQASGFLFPCSGNGLHHGYFQRRRLSSSTTLGHYALKKTNKKYRWTKKKRGGSSKGEESSDVQVDSLSLPFSSEYHCPVLCDEVVRLLLEGNDREGIYMDATLGGGGHTAAILSRLREGGRVVGVDQDPDALEFCSARLSGEIERGRLVIERANFDFLEDLLDEDSGREWACAVRERGGLDGLLLDLGVSSHQLDAGERGFAYGLDGPLDMRMDRESFHFETEEERQGTYSGDYLSAVEGGETDDEGGRSFSQTEGRGAGAGFMKEETTLGSASHFEELQSKGGMTDGRHGREKDEDLDGWEVNSGDSFHVSREGDGEEWEFEEGGGSDFLLTPQKRHRTAAELLNEESAEEISNVLYRYGEEKRARLVARTLVRWREEEGPFRRTSHLKEAVCRCTSPIGTERKKTLARVFQGLRLAVNQELPVLDHVLSVAHRLVRPGGRLVVLSYHSLEDRMVKNTIRHGTPLGEDTQEKPWIPVVKKAIIASTAEVAANPRARSAKLRAAERRAC